MGLKLVKAPSPRLWPDVANPDAEAVLQTANISCRRRSNNAHAFDGRQINLPCSMSLNGSVLSRGGTEAVASRSGLGFEEKSTHTGWALRIDPQGHRIQSGRTNKRRGRQGNLFNRAVAQQISAIRELKQFIWLEAAIMSSRTLAAAARTYFWRSAQKKE